MARAKSPRTAKPKAETNVLQMPENGSGRNGSKNHPADLETAIRQRAYELYLERGGRSGSETEDWLSAEREVLAQSRTA
jgi:hypothetical protein